MGDSNGTVGHVENETKSSALVEMFKKHIRTIERITDMKLMSRSDMTIILSSSIFEPSQHSVAVTVYHVVMSFKRLIYYNINLNLFHIQGI